MLKNKVSYETVMRFLKKNYPVIILMTIGILARGLFLNSFPGGINQDEAFSAYEAYSLINYGMDSSGYPFPVYLNAWGSGMNALNTYLMMPFMAIFGCEIWVARFPQFLVSCISLFVFYKLIKKILNPKAALIGLFYFAICPWHIMLARWGLESNLAPGFILFGFYFFVLGAENTKYYIWSALFYGLGLYSYATIWPIMPVMLGLQLLYQIYSRRFKLDRNVFISILILSFFTIPLILFLLVNYGYIHEIITPFFSIPKLTVMRQSEISLQGTGQKLMAMLRMIYHQNDGLYWNSTDEFGVYYKGFLVFGILGGIYGCVRFIKSIIRRSYDSYSMIFFPAVSSLLLGALINVNINRINCIHIPIIVFIATGIYLVIDYIGKHVKYFPHIAVSLLFVLFIMFERFYFTRYNDKLSYLWQQGTDSSLEYAMQLTNDGEPIYISPGISYSKVLFFSEYPVDQYRKTVIYTNYPSICLYVTSFGPFRFNIDNPSPGPVYVITYDEIPGFKQAGFDIQQFGYTAVAY